MCAQGIGVTGSSQTVVSIDKTAGRPLMVNLGDVLKGEVIDILSDGSVALKLNGMLVSARTEVPLAKGTEVLFKVVGTTLRGDSREIHLQFKGTADGSDPTRSDPAARLAQRALSDLVHEYSQILSGPDAVNEDVSSVLERLFKAVAAQTSALPSKLRSELQALLKTSLQQSAQPLHERLDSLLLQLRDLGSDLSFPLDRFLEDLVLHMEDLSGDGLKESVKSTGVALEARLKRMDTGDDLKGMLGQLKQALEERIGDSLLEEMEGADGNPAVQEGRLEEGKVNDVMKNVSGLLKDIQSFQLLSKGTDSFSTFLPLVWSEIRSADIAFKRGGGTTDGSKSYYCMINLNLASLGALGIMIMMREDEFMASFKVSDQQLKSSLETHARELQEHFREQGLRLNAVHIHGSGDQSLAPFEKLESLDGLLSVRV